MVQNSETPARAGVPNEVWPPDQKLETCIRDPTVLITDFNDIGSYHPGLIRRILELEHDPELSHRPIFGGRKVSDIPKWNCPEADFIHARALAFYRKITNQPNLVVDQCWASISRSGDYLGPHSHLRAVGSIVYAVQLGEQDAERPLLGKLTFSDPRFASFCPDQEDCMTREFTPTMAEGCMILFPAQLVHYVHPYFGATPRITMSWNIR